MRSASDRELLHVVVNALLLAAAVMLRAVTSG